MNKSSMADLYQQNSRTVNESGKSQDKRKPVMSIIGTGGVYTDTFQTGSRRWVRGVFVGFTAEHHQLVLHIGIFPEVKYHMPVIDKNTGLAVIIEKPNRSGKGTYRALKRQKDISEGFMHGSDIRNVKVKGVYTKIILPFYGTVAKGQNFKNQHVESLIGDKAVLEAIKKISSLYRHCFKQSKDSIESRPVLRQFLEPLADLVSDSAKALGIRDK